MEPNTDRMTFAIVVLLIGGALAGILLTPGLPNLMGLQGTAGTTVPNTLNFLQWIFSLVGDNFSEMIGRDTTGGDMGVINLLGTIKSL